MQVLEPRPRRWSRQEYYKMADSGLFQDQRVELIDGEIVQTMSPQKNAHSVAIELVERCLEAAFGPHFWVRTQRALRLASRSEPEPDLAVVKGSPRDFNDHPTTALLVVEVSDTTLAFDTGRKASLYAAAGFADYWVVDLVNEKLRVFRRPVADPAADFGHRFADVAELGRNETISPLARPTANLPVEDLLP